MGYFYPIVVFLTSLLPRPIRMRVFAAVEKIAEKRQAKRSQIEKQKWKLK